MSAGPKSGQGQTSAGEGGDQPRRERLDRGPRERLVGEVGDQLHPLAGAIHGRVVALLDASMVAIILALAILRVGKIAENSLDYSLNNTVRNMLWLPTTKEMKYRAKQAIDSFFVRIGDVGSAAFVFVMADQLDLGVRAFAIANAVMIVGWIVVAVAILKKRQEFLAEQGIDEAAHAP